MFSRNNGFIKQETEQPILAKTRVAIAGAGGDGGQLAIALARVGFGSFRLADPENFEIENINRQAGSYGSTIGKNKAKVISSIIKDINKNAQVEVFEDGVTESNVARFLKDSDVVVDETEFTQAAIGTLIARHARQAELHVFMGLNVGFGCLVTSFNPRGITFEEYLGLDPNSDLKKIESENVPLERWVPIIPSYIDQETVKSVEQGKIAAPSVAPGVLVCAGILASEITNFILKKHEPIEAPKVFWFDAVERQVEVLEINQNEHS